MRHKGELVVQPEGPLMTDCRARDSYFSVLGLVERADLSAFPQGEPEKTELAGPRYVLYTRLVLELYPVLIFQGVHDVRSVVADAFFKAVQVL